MVIIQGASGTFTAITYTSPFLQNTGDTMSGTLAFNTPIVSTGLGVLINNNGTYTTTVPNGQELDLINLAYHHTQTSGGVSEFYGIKITTDSDAVDTAAGINISNIGKSDAMYISMAGKGGSTFCTPTGIGLDMNRLGSGENGTANQGTGIQVWDWSQTSTGTNSPMGILLNKQLNPNTSHTLLRTISNRSAMQLLVPEGASYDSSQYLIQILGGAAGAYNTPRLHIMPTGKIGIGPNTPSAFLHIVDGSRSNIKVEKTGANANVAEIFNDGNLHISGGSTNTWVDAGGSNALILNAGGTGNVGVGMSTPTAALHLKAGTATANTAPLKLTAGTNLATPENGTLEYDGTHLYFTTGGVRTTIV